jgi:predicted Zn-dependent protease with MMP-like domain
MKPEEFEALVAEAFTLVPEKFRSKVKNVGLLIEDDSPEHLLGLYRGIPATERGEGYGVGMTMPDTITIFREPILAAAAHESGVGELVAWGEEMTEPLRKRVKMIIRNTIWHEIAHYFGMDEFEVEEREAEGTNEFPEPPKTP